MSSSRRKLLNYAGAAAASTVAFPSVLRAARKRFRWRLAMAVPKTLPVWGSGVTEFAEKVSTMTDGKLSIKVYGAGELIPALATFDAVSQGQIQMGHAAAYYWQGKLPAAPFFTGVPFGMNALGMRAWIHHGGGQQLWDKLYEPFGVQGIPAGNTGVQMGGWYRKPITKVKDFSGLKMRIPGLGGKVLEQLGGKPILVPGGEIFTNLATGVIDATEWVGPYHDYIMGFYKAAKIYHYPGWHEPGSVLELMVNRKAFEELPKAYQLIIRSAAAELESTMHSQWVSKDSEYMEKIRGLSDVQVIPFPDEVITALAKSSHKVIDSIAATSALAGEIVTSYRRFQKSYEGHQEVSERAYVRAQQSAKL